MRRYALIKSFNSGGSGPVAFNTFFRKYSAVAAMNRAAAKCTQEGFEITRKEYEVITLFKHPIEVSFRIVERDLSL